MATHCSQSGTPHGYMIFCATWYIAGRYLGFGIGFLFDLADSIHASFAFKASFKAFSGDTPKAAHCFKKKLKKGEKKGSKGVTH